MTNRIELKKQWLERIRKHLVGRTIKQVHYMTDKDLSELDWLEAAIVLVLDNGEMLYPSSDDEGNGAGALHTTIDKLPIIPVI
jgi:hypothetical protein